MPLPAILPFIPAIASGVAAIGQTITGISNRRWQAKQNEIDRKWQDAQYARMRKDALADRDFENAYSSPEQQMERLRQAGLNPNLIYGKGAEMVSASTRGSQMPQSNQPAPQLDINYGSIASQLGTSLMQYYDAKSKVAQTDNTLAATEVLKREAVLKEKEGYLKDATLAQTLQNTARSKFDYEQAMRLKDVTYENAILTNQRLESDIQTGAINREKTSYEIEKIKTDMAYTIAESARQDKRLDNEGKRIANEWYVQMRQAALLEAQKAKTQSETAINEVDRKIADERYFQAQSMTAKLSSDADIRAIERDLAKQGIFPGDKAFTREIMQWLKESGNHSQGGAVKNPDGTYDRTRGWSPYSK